MRFLQVAVRKLAARAVCTVAGIALPRIVAALDWVLGTLTPPAAVPAPEPPAAPAPEPPAAAPVIGPSAPVQSIGRIPDPPCETCKGSGLTPDKKAKCGVCKGWGTPPAADTTTTAQPSEPTEPTGPSPRRRPSRTRKSSSN